MPASIKAGTICKPRRSVLILIDGNFSSRSSRHTKEGFPVVEYRPTVLNFSEPMKQLDAAMRARLIIHGGDPVMEWEISNVVGTPDKKDNVYPNKPDGQAHLKIDNPVALMSALGVHMGQEEEQVAASPWDDPDYSMSEAADA